MSQDLESVRKAALEYFKIQEAGDLERGLELFTEDATWWIPGDWELAGTFSKEQMRQMMAGLNVFEPGGLSFKLHSVTAEENRVAVMAEINGKLRDGRVYHNFVFFLFEIENGKIKRISEVPDSAKSRQFWLGK